MAIIYLTISLRQALQGQTGQRPDCPADPRHPLVRNGSFYRHAYTAQGVVRIRIQRYFCRSCHVTYSALPYDCQPHTAMTWALTLALLVWKDRGWSTRRGYAWLAERRIDPHPRTMGRWTARWRAGLGAVVQRALEWIAQTLGTRRIPVWPRPEWSPVQHWQQLWRAVVQILPAGRRGGWMAGSVLWGWVSHHNQCRAGNARGVVYPVSGGEIG
jgi:hypothetical protein